ncbi:MAG: M3 family metallopeptidase [Scrofimicrobium sp.]
MTTEQRIEVTRKNPIMEPSGLPFGVPEFAAIEVADLEPAVMAGIQEELEDWDRIATNPESADVENTVEAVDRAGELLTRANGVFWTLASSIGGPELDELQERLAPIFAAHSDDFYTNEQLYERYREVAALKNLDDETRWLVDQTLKDFERSGVKLNARAKEDLRAMNQEIASLEAQIDTRISRQLQDTGITGEDLSELEGLSDGEVAAAKADEKKGSALWRMGVSNFSAPPKLASLKNPEVRARALQNSLDRGSTGDSATDTRDLIVKLTKLRARRARLLGYSSHAAIVIDEETVPSPEAARELLTQVGGAAKAALDREAEDYAKLAREDGIEFSVADWAYYEERARKSALGVDSAELRDYFELNRVVKDGIFFAAHRLYGLTFEPRPDIVGWSPETESWEVRGEDGETIGLFMADYYLRPGKSGGAWMSDIFPGSERSGKLPVITNNANFEKPAEDEPTLLTWDNVETVFHEFGHALHGLLTKTHYDATAGTNVPRDFVELPSQLNEMWAFHPEVLASYAKHWKTGEELPLETREALARSKFFGQPYATLEYVQSALIDQAWHDNPTDLPEDGEQVESFEADSLEGYGVADPFTVPRYRSPYFAHAFAGGYDAGYYSYMWAEAMVGELEEWFRGDASNSGDGGLNREAGEKLRVELLSRGNSRDPLESFVAVRGHEPEGTAVIRRRGL